MDPVSGSACLFALVGLLAAIIFLQLLALLLLRCTSCLRGETAPRYSWTASRGHGDAQPVAAVVPYKRSLAEIRADRPKALPDQQEQGRLMAMLSWLCGQGALWQARVGALLAKACFREGALDRVGQV